jgi:cytosine/adenosine deaminase-related metal-dependent hydrolase
MRTLIKGAAIVTADPASPDLERGDILVDGRTIMQIAPVIDVADARVIDASHMIAIPGMVDTHRHTWQTALRCIGADWTAPDYIRGVRVQMGPRYRAEDVYAGNYVGALDALNCGITTLVDYSHNIVTREHGHAAVTGLRDAGIRALYGHGLTPVTTKTWSGAAQGGATSGLETAEDRAAFAEVIRDEYFSSDDQLLQFGICPEEIPIAGADLVVEVAAARKLDARVILHANQLCVRQLFMDVAALYRLGLLGPDMLLVHCSFNTDEEWRMMADAGASVSVCPDTELQMGMGFPAIRQAVAHLGGPSLANDCVIGTGGDMITIARTALQIARWESDSAGYQRWIAPQTMSWRAADALRWATINGARAAGLDDRVGSLTPGKEADIVLLNARTPSLAGWNRRDPAGVVISQMNSGNVDTVLVAGQIVKHQGRLVHVDVDAAYSLIEESQDYLYECADANGGFIPQPPVDIPLYRERA